MLASDHSVGGEKNVPIVKNVLLRKKTFWHVENLMVANILAIKFATIKILLAERFHSGARLSVGRSDADLLFTSLSVARILRALRLLTPAGSRSRSCALLIHSTSYPQKAFIHVYMNYMYV